MHIIENMKKSVLILFSVICIFVLVVFVLFNLVMFPKRYNRFVSVYSAMFDVDRALVFAVIKTESGFDRNAVSSSGARGLMQLMPKTAGWIAEEMEEVFDESNLFDAEVNIKYGCFYLKYLIDKFKDVWLAVAAYNAGESVVKNWINQEGKLVESKISYPETKNYVVKVKRYFRVYKNLENQV